MTYCTNVFAFGIAGLLKQLFNRQKICLLLIFLLLAGHIKVLSVLFVRMLTLQCAIFRTDNF